MEISCSELSVHRAHQNTVKVASAHRYSEHAFFFSVLPLQTLALEKSRNWGQERSRAILISSFPLLMSQSGEKSCRPAITSCTSTALLSEREITWSRLWHCHLREGNAIPCVTSSQGARVPKVIGILISPRIIWVGGGTGSFKAGQQESHCAQQVGSKLKRCF